jgi:hypothetical protein
VTPVQALQKALAAEHAAVFLYGLLGAQSSQSRQPTLFAQLTDAYADHRAARDELTVLIDAKGTDPVASRTDYEVPGPTDSPAQIQAVAHTAERDRAWAIAALDAGALREMTFGAAPSDFPGLR